MTRARRPDWWPSQSTQRLLEHRSDRLLYSQLCLIFGVRRATEIMLDLRPV